jgi:hypothetical protein
MHEITTYKTMQATRVCPSNWPHCATQATYTKTSVMVRIVHKPPRGPIFWRTTELTEDVQYCTWDTQKFVYVYLGILRKSGQNSRCPWYSKCTGSKYLLIYCSIIYLVRTTLLFSTGTTPDHTIFFAAGYVDVQTSYNARKHRFGIVCFHTAHTWHVL